MLIWTNQDIWETFSDIQALAQARYKPKDSQNSKSSFCFQTFPDFYFFAINASWNVRLPQNYKKIEMLQTNHDRNTICSSISTQPFTISWKGFLEAILQCHSAAPWKYHRKLHFVCLFYHYFRVCRVEEGNI